MLLAALFMVGAMNAQMLLDEGFDGGIPSTWTMYNDANTPRMAQLFPTAWVDSRALLGGYGYAVSTSYFSPAATANRWLVTPRIAVPDSHYYLTFRASSYDHPEKLVIKASNTSVQQNNFTITLQTIEHLPGNWTTYSIPLDDFEGTSCYLAFQLKTYDGYLCLLDHVAIQRPAANEIKLTSIEANTYTIVGDSLKISGKVQNMGYRSLTSFDARYVVDGDTSEVFHIAGINIPYGESTLFTHNLPYPANAAGSHIVHLLVSQPNGVSDSGTDNASTPFHAIFIPDDGISTRQVLLELFTDSQSGYAPEAESRITEATQGLSDVIWITHHAGYKQDALSNAASDSLTWYFGDSQWVPAMMTDRHNFAPRSYESPMRGVGQPDEILATINEARRIPCQLSLHPSEVTYDPISRHVSGTLSGTFGSPIYSDATHITLYLVEDSIFTNQTSYQGGESCVIEDYVNNHIVRTAATAAFGNDIRVNSNWQFGYYYHFTLAQDINPYRTHLVAVVGNRNPYNCNNSLVFNVAKTANIAKRVGMQEAPEISVSTYPNPASDVINVSSNATLTNVTLTNVQGKILYRGSPSGNRLQINTSCFPSGLYFLTLYTLQGITTRRISIAK